MVSCRFSLAQAFTPGLVMWRLFLSPIYGATPMRNNFSQSYEPPSPRGNEYPNSDNRRLRRPASVRLQLLPSLRRLLFLSFCVAIDRVFPMAVHRIGKHDEVRAELSSVSFHCFDSV